MTLAARHVQAQGPAAVIRQNVDLGAEAAPAAAEGGIRLFVWGTPAALTCAHAPVGLAAIDCVSLIVRGRQLAPRRAPMRAIQRSASIKRRQ